MAEIIIPPGFVQHRLRYRLTLDPEEMVITLGTETSGDFTPNEHAASIYVRAQASISGAPEMYPQWSFVGVTSYIGQDGGPPIIGQYDSVLVGTRSAAETPPNNCAVLIRKTSALAGRRNRGRFFCPPFALGEAAVGNTGVIAAPTLGGLQTNWTEFYTELTTGPVPLPPVLFHSQEPFAPTPVTGFVVQAQIATQRTRMRR